ncbi:hypothetical protein E8E14_001038 [Neopestalotiopsis sp. 37M]|nr:hypothetical protein E8E14_001038 [Neopestalotiopsis sp. 37M]
MTADDEDHKKPENQKEKQLKQKVHKKPKHYMTTEELQRCLSQELEISHIFEHEAKKANLARKLDAREARLLHANNQPIPETCGTQAHDPRCMMQMQVDDLGTRITREFAVANCITLDPLQAISQEQLGKWFPSDVSR